MAIKTLLSRPSGPPSHSAAGRVWSFLLYAGIPILLGLGLAASLLLQPRYTDVAGQPLTARFLHADTGLDPAQALERLRNRPTRLASADGIANFFGEQGVFMLRRNGTQE